jgi:hypothetical protein
MALDSDALAQYRDAVDEYGECGLRTWLLSTMGCDGSVLSTYVIAQFE